MGNDVDHPSAISSCLLGVGKYRIGYDVESFGCQNPDHGGYNIAGCSLGPCSAVARVIPLVRSLGGIASHLGRIFQSPNDSMKLSGTGFEAWVSGQYSGAHGIRFAVGTGAKPAGIGGQRKELTRLLRDLTTCFGNQEETRLYFAKLCNPFFNES